MSPGAPPADAAPGGLPGLLRRLGLHTSLYALTTLLAQGLQFLLVPLYTRALTPGDYGILTLTSTVYLVAGILLGLQLHSALSRLYFAAPAPQERGPLYGTLVAFLVVVPGAVVLGLDRLGMHGWFELLAPVPFDPYLRLALWAAYLSLFLPLPVTVYTAAQRPQAVLCLTVTGTLATAGLTLLFVVARGEGAVGSLKALVLSNLLTATLAIASMGTMASVRWSGLLLRRALVLALPLVPHVVGTWAIGQCDRVILAAHVPLADLGRYALAYQVAFAVTVVATAVHSAVAPLVFSQFTEGGHRQHVPPLGTYAVLMIALACLGGALLGGDLIRLVTPAQFHAAAAFVPWLALGNGLLGLYFVWSLGSRVAMRTGWVPVGTLLAGLVSVGLNLWSIPRYGLVAAPITMAASYAALALIHGGLAHLLCPIRWEYGRWGKVALVGALCYGLALTLPHGTLAVNMLVKVLVVVVGVPTGLLLVGFVSPEEWQYLRNTWVHARGRS